MSNPRPRLPRQPANGDLQDVPGQVSDYVGGMAEGILALSGHLRTPGSERWVHTTTELPNPRDLGKLFGKYRVIHEYPEGVDLSRWPSDIGAVSITLKRADNERLTVIIGHATEESVVNNAGEQGPYLLWSFSSNGPQHLRYLDPIDLAVTIVPGEVDPRFPPNPGRNRQLGFKGEVERVQGFTQLVS